MFNTWYIHGIHARVWFNLCRYLTFGWTSLGHSKCYKIILKVNFLNHSFGSAYFITVQNVSKEFYTEKLNCLIKKFNFDLGNDCLKYEYLVEEVACETLTGLRNFYP